MTILEGREFMGGKLWDNMKISFTPKLDLNSDTEWNTEEVEKTFIDLYNTLWKEIANEQAANRARNK